MPKNIVTIGGGSGHYAVLSALSEINGLKINAVVSMADSGGSTGRLRDELGVLPPGDILKCLVALSRRRDHYRSLLMQRFESNNRLYGHSVGNLLLTFLASYTGDFSSAVEELGSLIGSQGKVVPVTLDDITLVAKLHDGSEIIGEAAIDVPTKKSRAAIKDIYLKANNGVDIKANPMAIKAIAGADHIIIGPGDLYTSLIPNLIVTGIAAAIKNSPAKKTYILNIMTKRGETEGMSGHDFLNIVAGYLGLVPDLVIANNRQPEARISSLYINEGAKPVMMDDSANIRVDSYDLLSESGELARHDIMKLRQALIASLKL